MLFESAVISKNIKKNLMPYHLPFIPDGMNGFERNVKRLVDMLIAF